MRGTSFRIAIAEPDPSCGGGTTTRVTVYEGVVSVRHEAVEVRVPAHETWPAACSSATRRSPATSRAARAVAAGNLAGVSPRAPGAPEPSTNPPGTSEASSDLAEQNDAFARAVAAKRRGAVGEAVAAFEAFVARYPSSALAESALSERMKLLRTSDPARASVAAAQYLLRYPTGFARSEAEAIQRGAR